MPTNVWNGRLSALGLILGSLLFAASLTPSLLPRDFVFQGILGGSVFAIGYWIGGILQWVWRFLELPVLPIKIWRIAILLAAVVSGILVSFSLSRAAGWQNSIREKVGMPNVDTAHPIQVAIIAFLVAVVLLGLIWLVLAFMRALITRAYRRVPRRYTVGLAGMAAFFVVVMLADGLVVRLGIGAMDEMFRLADTLIDPETPQPTDPLKSGSDASLVRWDELGATGRAYVDGGPSVDDIKSWTNRPALKPLRVYVGANSAPTVEERAHLAVQELIRVGGFDRSVLVVATPTGTGWMDAAAFDTLEILHGGDVATVAMQYSYLSSYVSMMVEPDISTRSARALFVEVYGHWQSMPRDERPELYLFGLSLGAYGSESSARVYEMLNDPMQGALWVGPPFLNRTHRDVTRARNPDSPAWLPKVGNGALVRFKNQYNDISGPDDDWGPIRIVYLQYASDPIVFFSPSAFYRRPEWLTPRGPDVSEQLQWVPVVTFAQMLVDMANSLVTPLGHGHYYAHKDYIDGWMAVTSPDGWDMTRLEALKSSFPTTPAEE